jgi:Cu(I)/Ag(I) efflux system membrane protein CusA/SilA
LITTDGRVGQARFRGRQVAVAIAADAEQTSLAQALRDVTVRAAAGHGEVVPLGLLGQAAFARLPAALRTEAGQPVEILHIDLQPGVDLMDFVERGRQAVARAVGDGTLQLRPGERLEWAGQYQLVQSTQRRLWIIVPLVLLSMMALLILQFRNVTEAAIVLSVVPFALVGSVWTLFLLRYPLSAPVWVGLLSVAGLAMQTGVVMVVYIDQAFHRRVRDGRLRTREDIVAAHAEGTVRRLRPKVMTLTTMAFGLLPLLWAGGDDAAGAEIMKRVAAPMLGGLLSSAFLTLEVLPVIYTIWRHRQLRRAEREGRSIADVVGYVPSWARPPD